jgi:hypothetical protein
MYKYQYNIIIMYIQQFVHATTHTFWRALFVNTRKKRSKFFL